MNTLFEPAKRNRTKEDSQMRSIHQEVTEQIIAELKSGVRPWIKPWSKTPGLNIACNAVTGRPYSGINTLLLFRIHGQNQQPRFLTFKQAQAAGGNVRKGEHGHMVVFVGNAIKKEIPPSEEPDTYRFLKGYTVFNISQCDSLPDKLTTMPAGPNKEQRDQLLQEFIALTGANVEEKTTLDEAKYIPSADRIMIPAFRSFLNQTSYYSTLFHELTHWTGHTSRLDRYVQLAKRFDTHAYHMEELIAELGAAYLCAEFSIDGFVPQAAAYIEDFVKVLSADPRAIFTAASKAQEAVDFLRCRLLTDSKATAAAAPSTDAGAMALRETARIQESPTAR
jgi:antirestriction protein ArdC